MAWEAGGVSEDIFAAVMIAFRTSIFRLAEGH